MLLIHVKRNVCNYSKCKAYEDKLLFMTEAFQRRKAFERIIYEFNFPAFIVERERENKKVWESRRTVLAKLPDYEDVFLCFCNARAASVVHDGMNLVWAFSLDILV